MPMSTAAARASSTTASPAGGRGRPAGPPRAAAGCGQRWRRRRPRPSAAPSLSAPPSSTDWRFRRMSLAASGRAAADFVEGDHARHLQRGLALLPVAGAELVGLQRVEHAQHLGHVAADRQVVDARPADDALGIDDEGRAERHAVLLVEDAEGLRRARAWCRRASGREGCLRSSWSLRQARWTKCVSVLAPSTCASRSAKSRVAAAELGDLGGADEGEVHRPEEEDLPLARDRSRA